MSAPPPRARPSLHDRIEISKRAVLFTRSRLLARVRHPRQYVFVVSSGRSGSTLVQGLLNALPGVLVRGENGFYLMELFRAQRRVRQFQHAFGPNSWNGTSAFYGIAEADADDFLRVTRTLMHRQLIARKNPWRITVIGFKEVRWEELHPDEYAGFFRFFERIFPDAKYVLNDRDPERTAGSGHWRSLDRGTALATLQRGRDVREFLRTTRPERTFDITYEVVTGAEKEAADAQLSGLAEFVIGWCTPKVLADLRAVLEVGHGPFPFGAARRRRRLPAQRRPAAN